jgi:hypothetical protein
VIQVERVGELLRRGGHLLAQMAQDRGPGVGDGVLGRVALELLPQAEVGGELECQLALVDVAAGDVQLGVGGPPSSTLLGLARMLLLGVPVK